MNKKKTIIFFIIAFIFLTGIYIISKKREQYLSSNLFDYIYKDYKEYSNLKGDYKNFNKEFFAALDSLKNDLIKAKYLNESSDEELLENDIYDYLSIDYHKAKLKGIDIYFEQINMINNIHLDIKSILEDKEINHKEYEYINLSLEYIEHLKEDIKAKEEEIENNYLKFAKEIKTKTLYDFTKEFTKKKHIIKYLETKKIIEDIKDNNKDLNLIYEEYKNNKAKHQEYKEKMKVWTDFHNKNYVDFDLDKQKKEIKEIVNRVSNKLGFNYEYTSIELIDNNRFIIGNRNKDGIIFDIDISKNTMQIEIEKTKKQNLNEEDITKLGYKKINEGRAEYTRIMSDLEEYKYIISKGKLYRYYEKYNNNYYDSNNALVIYLKSGKDKEIRLLNISDFYRFLEEENNKDYKSRIEKDKNIIKKQIKKIKSISPILSKNEFTYNIYFEDDYSIDVQVENEEVNIKQIYLYKKY